MNRTKNSQSGFSLLEVVVVMAVMTVVLSFAVFATTNVMPNYTADSALNVVMGTFRTAKQTSIAQRRDVQVWIDQAFSGPEQAQHINYQVIAIAGDQPQPMVSVALPRGAQLVLEPGVPDTPMGFGNPSAVLIGNVDGGPPIMMFRPSGAFTDANYALLNGTLFIGVPGQASTARAVAIMGGVASVVRFSWSGSEWVR
jgi:prepilin-type N-terminal cleavage/methylation domain-containing protein